MTAIYSIVDFKKLHPGLDFDAEHYHPSRLSAWNHLSVNSEKSVGHYFDEIIDVRDCDTETEVYDLTDALGCFLSAGGNRSGLSAKKISQPKDIIVSRLRSYLKETCVIPNRGKDFKPLLSTEFLVFRAKQEPGSWLLPFLLSDTIQTILNWSQTGNNHPRIRASNILELPIPKNILSIKNKIAALTEDALQTYESGLYLYPEIEAELLERIGWSSIIKKHSEIYYLENYKNIMERERLDAEHYQPKYKRLCERLKDIGAQAVGNFCVEPRRGVQPLFSEDGEVSVIDSKAVRPLGVEPNKSECTSFKFYNSPFAQKGHISKGDVLLNSTGVGTLGRASFYDSDVPAIADNHVAIIQPDPKVCLPVYLSLFLNSPVGLAQSEMYQTGSSGQLELYPQHIQSIIVYLPKTKSGKVDIAWQEKVVEKILRAASANNEAKAKLEAAKQLIDKNI